MKIIEIIKLYMNMKQLYFKIHDSSINMNVLITTIQNIINDTNIESSKGYYIFDINMFYIFMNNIHHIYVVHKN